MTPETARLLQHWRHHSFQGIRPFFCQVEAVETAIWLTEVAPKMGKHASIFWAHIKGANEQANPEILRMALKLATGAGKTTVMAMLIAWQTVNAVRHPNRKPFSRGFLIITPGITIRDRLRVLQPNDPDSYFRGREIVPSDMLSDLARAKIVITNYHAFKRRERLEISKVGRLLLQGRGPDLETVETEGQMLQRIMPDLMGMKHIVVLNDEAHHCYRERVRDGDINDLKGEDKDEAKKNNEAARLWISGIETVKRKLDVRIVYDLSATPFFLRGSGYAEGTLFPWTVSDFSLMDAIESGIVKLPRVPIADNIPSGDMPKFRNLWDHIGKKMPKKGRGKAAKNLDPLSLPAELQTALQALYGHYKQTYDAWEKEGLTLPPVFIVVCNNTSTSKLVYDFISGFRHVGDDGEAGPLHDGRLELFRNYDDYGNRLPQPRTLLIDSQQLESGEALDKDFRDAAADEIERFRREIVERTGDIRAGDHISDQELLREVMNTVGKPGRLGESIRCVVSVSMLTEGWDANTVTHILGVRAFGTQLLCEQVVGRALRRQSYDLNEKGLFNPEYADVLGIPFDFAAKPVVVAPAKPLETIRVHAVSPDRDALEIRFPRVEGYRVELPNERLTANFGPDAELNLTPDLVGPSITRNQGIVGTGVDLTVKHLEDTRRSKISLHLARHILFQKFREPGEIPNSYRLLQLRRITRQWLDSHLNCTGGTYPAQLLYQEIADIVCEKIYAAITVTHQGDRPVKAILDAYNPTGSTRHVNFTTSKTERWKTDPRCCHINWVICDSDWEAEFCRVAQALARARIMGARYPYYFLADTPEGQRKEAEVTRTTPSTAPTHGDIRQGFVYERVPHITLKSIANNAEIDVIWERFQETLEPLRQALNAELDTNWEEWEIPREANDDWSAKAQELHATWWETRIARQKEIDASIAAKAGVEYLYDKPYEDKSRVRVAGPFTVESLLPHRVLAVDEDDELMGIAEGQTPYGEQDFGKMVLDHLKTSGVQQAHKEDRIMFTSIAGWPGEFICAEGRYREGDGETERRAGIFIGPEYGTVARPDLVDAAREAAEAAFDVLIACAFNFDAHSAEFDKLGRIPVLKARMNADLHMANDLKNTGQGNLFVVFGEPDISIKDADHGQVQVKIHGVDVFHPQSGEIESGGPESIAVWFIDTDYNGESFFVRHAYFLGASDPYKSLKTTLKADIDQEAWESLHRDISRPFTKPASGRIAVKVINHLGDEVMKVFRVT